MDFKSPDIGPQTPEQQRPVARAILLSKSTASDNFRDFLKKKLEGLDLQIRTYTTTKDASSAIQASRKTVSPIDLIIVDDADERTWLKRIKTPKVLIIGEKIENFSAERQQELGLTAVLDYNSKTFEDDFMAFLEQIKK